VSAFLDGKERAEEAPHLFPPHREQNSLGITTLAFSSDDPRICFHFFVLFKTSRTRRRSISGMKWMYLRAVR
jgi:hypothetical protein